MLVQAKRTGLVYELHRVFGFGVRFCSVCGRKMEIGHGYTRHQIFHPVTRKPAVLTQCTDCFPVEEVKQPSQPIPLDYMPTRIEVEVVRENTPAPQGWDRTLDHGEYRVEAVTKNGIREALRRVIG